METRLRSVVKALSWQVIGLFSMTAVGYAITGSARAGGAMALASGAIGLVAFIFHERLWARVRWGTTGTGSHHRQRP
jgi:uncharacterized membrane protein